MVGPVPELPQPEVLNTQELLVSDCLQVRNLPSPIQATKTCHEQTHLGNIEDYAAIRGCA